MLSIQAAPTNLYPKHADSKMMSKHLLSPLRLLVFSSLFFACEQPEQPAPNPALTVIAPADRAHLKVKDVGFHWTSNVANGFQFRLYANGRLLADLKTNEDHVFPSAGKEWGHYYEWEVIQGNQRIRRSYFVDHILQPFAGMHDGVTEHFVSATGVTDTYADQLAIGLSAAVVSAALAGDNAAVGGGTCMRSQWDADVVLVQWGDATSTASMEVSFVDSSLSFQLRRVLNAQGDYETYRFLKN